MLPARSQKLVEATPIHKLQTGFKACLELTVYPKGHTGITVSEIQGSPAARRIVQRDFLQLNNLGELHEHADAVIDHLAQQAGLDPQPDAAWAQMSADATSGWTTADLEHELSRFEQVLTDAGLRKTSIDTYVGRASIFLRWLRGDYEPRGPAGG